MKTILTTAAAAAKLKHIINIIYHHIRTTHNTFQTCSTLNIV